MSQLILISESQLAKTLLITERQVRKLFKEYKYAPGEYEYHKCVKKYIAQLKSGEGGEEGLKLKKAKRETEEFKLKILKDEYLSAILIKEHLADIFIKFKAQLLGISRKIVIELEQNEEKEIKEVVEKHVLKALEELTRYEPPSNKGGGK